MWVPSDMFGIDPDIMFHHLTIKPIFKTVTQRKRNEGEDKRLDISEEVKRIENF